MKLFTWVNNHHYFDWCALMERIWRARIAKNPKSTRRNQ